MDLQDTAFLLKKESSLRQILEKKPTNSKARSRLAGLLAERAAIVGNKELRMEAIALAEQAVEMAPRKPFGYAALSSIYTEECKRMDMLQKAIDRSGEEKHHIACVGLKLRRLVEPRDIETRRVKGKIGKASINHPNKRKLSTAEEAWYKDLASDLTHVWGQSTLTSDQIGFLAKIEYKLGLFFRKKEPSNVTTPRTRKHLEKSLQSCSSFSRTGMAEFWLATLDDDTPCTTGIAKCPPEYIVGLYSTFASNFDDLLIGKLGYQTPTLLRRLLRQHISSSTTVTRALDMGCGTGISGAAFRDMVDTLHGVDLSPEMIEKAKERKCYDRLRVGDIAFSLKTDEIYDLIFACDVFCYIGDLSEIFDGVLSSLSQGGLFCFSTEYLEEEEVDVSFKLHSCARFAHKQSYIREIACLKGFEVVDFQITGSLRRNKGRNVKGMLAVLKPR
eukprot:scaffold22560_cov135-Cylindrotheca_fusiformis.AAC.77